MTDGRTPDRVSPKGDACVSWASGLVSAAVFLLTGGLAFQWFIRLHRSNVWRVDGASQHFPAFYYARTIVGALLHHPATGLPMWTWNLGFGADTLGTLSYYLTDPFNALAIAFPMKHLVFAFFALWLLRLACAGLVCYQFLRAMSARRLAATAGTLVYVFTGYTLFATIAHPYFANPMVYLPLLLLGVEYVFRGRRPWVFVLGILLAATSNIYFFYQLTIIVILYAFLRHLEISSAIERWRLLWPRVWRTALYYVLGVALGAILVAPMVVAILGSSRSAHAAIPLFATAEAYRMYLVGLTASVVPLNVAYEGFAVASILLLPALFMRRRRDLTVRIMVIAFVIFLVFPFFGSLFNGMLFPSYRILYALALFLAMAVAAILSDPEPLSVVELAVTAVLYAVYAWGVLSLVKPEQLAYVTGPLWIGAGTWLALALERAWVALRGARAAADNAALPRSASEWFRAVVVALIVANIAFNAWAFYSPDATNELSAFLPSKRVMHLYRTAAGTVPATLPVTGISRVDKQVYATGNSFEISVANDGIIQDYDGTSFYYSIMSRGMFDYMSSLNDRPMKFAFTYNGVDDRATLETLGAVRYYIENGGAPEYVPYGFDAYSTVGTATVYQNRYALPVGYVYHAALPRAAYNAMSPLARQQVMLDAAVVDTGTDVGLPAPTARPEIVDVPYTITAPSAVGIDTANHRFVARQPVQRLHLHFAPVADSELYIQMNDTTYHDPTPGVQTWTIAPLVFGVGRNPKAEGVDAPDYHYAWGDHSELVNLGYSKTGRTSAYIGLHRLGTYGYSSLHVYALPMHDFAAKTALLRDESLHDIVVGTNSLKGRVTVKSPGLLFFSIPYSSGWRAMVDGKPAPIVHANLGFMAVKVSPGDHAVELHFLTPGLLSGAGVSVLALLIAIAATVIARRRKRAEGDSESAAASDELESAADQT